MNKKQKETFKKFEEDLIDSINNIKFSNPIILIHPLTLYNFNDYCIAQMSLKFTFRKFLMLEDYINKNTYGGIPFKIDSTIDSETFKIINDTNE